MEIFIALQGVPGKNKKRGMSAKTPRTKGKQLKCPKRREGPRAEKEFLTKGKEKERKRQLSRGGKKKIDGGGKEGNCHGPLIGGKKGSWQRAIVAKKGFPHKGGREGKRKKDFWEIIGSLGQKRKGCVYFFHQRAKPSAAKEKDLLDYVIRGLRRKAIGQRGEKEGGEGGWVLLNERGGTPISFIKSRIGLHEKTKRRGRGGKMKHFKD